MPRKTLHDMVERNMLGYVTGMTDVMDAPVKQLHGHHRVVYHDVGSVLILAALHGGDFSDNCLAGILHLILDNAYSEGKKQLKNASKYIKQTRDKYVNIKKSQKR